MRARSRFQAVHARRGCLSVCLIRVWVYYTRASKPLRCAASPRYRCRTGTIGAALRPNPYNLYPLPRPTAPRPETARRRPHLSPPRGSPPLVASMGVSPSAWRAHAAAARVWYALPPRRFASCSSKHCNCRMKPLFGIAIGRTCCTAVSAACTRGRQVRRESWRQ